MSWRRLSNLVRRLPRTSDTVREIRGPVADWGPVEHLIATAIDVLNAANWQRASAGGKKTIAKPKPIRRPGDAINDPRSGLEPSEMADRLRKFHRRDKARTHRR